MKTNNQPVQYLSVTTEEQNFLSFLTECILHFIYGSKKSLPL